jgi:hypothetical protein
MEPVDRFPLILGAASIGAGILAISTCGVPFAGVLLALAGFGLAGACLYRDKAHSRQVVGLAVAGVATSLLGLIFGAVAVAAFIKADTPQAIASHSWWKGRVSPADVEHLADRFAAMSAGDALFVDRSMHVAIRSKVPASGFFQGRLNDTYRPSGISTPYICIYLPPEPNAQPPTREEALHLVRQKIDRAFADVRN